MLYALELIVAERCSIFLCDYEKMVLSSALFYEENLSKGDKKVLLPMNKGVAGYVAVTGSFDIMLVDINLIGQALIINDPYNDPRFNTDIDQETGFVTKSILCFPIRNSDKIVAVAQLVNKKAGGFTKGDMALAKAFGVYCGIGLYNAQLYQELVKSEHKMKVALEVLSYHAMAKDEEVEMIERQSKEQIQKIPSAVIMPEMSSYEFDPNVPKDQMVHMLLAIFNDAKFPDIFNVPPRTLTRFFLTVIKYQNFDSFLHFLETIVLSLTTTGNMLLLFVTQCTLYLRTQTWHNIFPKWKCVRC
jgi:hypothetical protein